MTIDRAIEILNQNMWLGFECWVLDGDYVSVVSHHGMPWFSDKEVHRLSQKAAISVAEELERGGDGFADLQWALDNWDEIVDLSMVDRRWADIPDAIIEIAKDLDRRANADQETKV